MKQKVMVGIPTMTNRITIQIQRFLDLLRVASFEDPDFGLQISIQYGKTPVEFARNVICGDFLRSDCDKLLFIDEDMIPLDSVARLFHAEADITCAQMYTFDHSNPEKQISVGLKLCAMKEDGTGKFRPLIPPPGCQAVQDVDVCGTGCTLIHRRVLEDRRMWLPNVFEGLDGKEVDGNEDAGSGDYAPAIFRWLRAPSGMSIIGEDFDFCTRAKALGYSVQVDLNARCGHFKAINIDEAGDLAAQVTTRAMRGMQADGKVFQYVMRDAEEVA